jgi:hypothetical protein
MQQVSTMEAWEKLMERAKRTESRIRYKLDALINFGYQQLTMKEFLANGPPALLAHETVLSWGPITYMDEPHLCKGRADYSLFFGGKDHMSCHVVMIEAKQNG